MERSSVTGATNGGFVDIPERSALIAPRQGRQHNRDPPANHSRKPAKSFFGERGTIWVPYSSLGVYGLGRFSHEYNNKKRAGVALHPSCNWHPEPPPAPNVCIMCPAARPVSRLIQRSEPRRLHRVKLPCFQRIKNVSYRYYAESSAFCPPRFGFHTAFDTYGFSCVEEKAKASRRAGIRVDFR